MPNFKHGLLLFLAPIILSCDGAEEYQSRQFQKSFQILCLTNDQKSIELVANYYYLFYDTSEKLFTKKGYFADRKDSIDSTLEPLLYSAIRKTVAHYDYEALVKEDPSNIDSQTFDVAKESITQLNAKTNIDVQLNAILITPTSDAEDLNTEGVPIISYEINPKEKNLRFYLRNSVNENYGNFETLKLELEKNNKELVFAMNGGMYKKDGTPQGLYVENGKLLSPLDTLANGHGNFYLQPNGVLFLTNTYKAEITATHNFQPSSNILYATQSGPMLVINGKIHDKFTEGSKNVHIRNGVGVLPNGSLLFAISEEKINFYDFAAFFKKNGCENALYLDGFVSKLYLPSKDVTQMSGNFGVLIAEIK